MTMYGNFVATHDNLWWGIAIHDNLRQLLVIYDTKDVSPESCDGDGQKSTKLSDKAEYDL